MSLPDSRIWVRVCASLFVILILCVSSSYAEENETTSILDSAIDSAHIPEEEARTAPTPSLTTTDTDATAPSMSLVPPPLEIPPIKQLTLVLDWYLSPHHAALVVSQERGLFAAQGIEVELQTPADPFIAIKLLAAGEVDLALSRQPLLHLYAHEGTPISRIGTLFEAPLNAVIVAGSQQLDSQAQLASLHYGYTTREGRDMVIGQLSPMSRRQTDDYLTPDNVRFDAASAFRDERIDALADGYFYYLPPQLANEGISTHVVQYHEAGIPHHDGLVLLANSDKVVRDGPTWERLLTALEEASHWIINHPDDAWDLLITTHPILDNSINASAWQDILRRMTLSPGAVDARRYLEMENFLLQKGVIETTLPLSRLAVDPFALTD